MSRTHWSIETENIAGLRRLKLVVDTDDPAVVGMIEAAARRHGVELLRELDGPSPEEPKPEAEPGP